MIMSKQASSPRSRIEHGPHSHISSIPQKTYSTTTKRVMRLRSALVVILAAGVFATGYAVTDFSQTKFSQSQGNLLPEGQHATGDGNRFLRRGTTAAGDVDEERGLWTDMMARFPGTIENMVANTKKERQRIREQALVFAKLLEKEKMPYDVTKVYMKKGLSDHQAFKMGLRYETYKKNPWLYH